MWSQRKVYDIQKITRQNQKSPVTLCNLGVGATFGESILHDLPRDSTVVTKTTCELLRVETKDFRLIWEKNKELMNDIITNCKLKNGFGRGITPAAQTSPVRRANSPDHPNPALAITEIPSPAIARIGWALRVLLLSDSSSCLKDRKVSGKLIRKCALGTELVDWLMNLSVIVHTRTQAAGMWQAILEEGVLSHVNKEQPFKDKCFLYRFKVDEDGTGGQPTSDEQNAANEHVREALGTLLHRGSDATLRMILRKTSHERTQEELELVFEELLHIAALSHLSTSIKRELASIIVFEAHAYAGTILFNQGDEGRSWYIILKGSVDVVIHGKGTVATLKEGDDFGKLALINDAPRAATIVLKENNCHLVRVDKEHFNRILRDVEANTLRLQEHGKDVLVLERVAKQRGFSSAFKYTVMSGTPQKMLEHLLETRLGGQVGPNDPFLDDFLLTHIVFMPVPILINELAHLFHNGGNEENDSSATAEDTEYALTMRKRVIQFVQKWVIAVRQAVFEEPITVAFIEELASIVDADPDLQEEAGIMHHVLTQLLRYQEERQAQTGQKWKLPPNGQPICSFSGSEKQSRTPIRPEDDIIFRVYCADHTYCTLRFPINATTEMIKASAADKLQLNRANEDLVLAEVKSNGERTIFKDHDVSIPTALYLNARIFVSSKDHIDALTPLPEQEEITEGIPLELEQLGTKELAFHITQFDWDLFWSVHEYELLYHTFGRHHFGKITANLDVFIRRFNEIQYWVVTEIASQSSITKRVLLIRKFIKLAAYCKEYQNLNAFFAVVMGLSNNACSRLTQSWDKVPSKFKKLFMEFEALIDPSRNHRAYRSFVGKLQPPVIPFMPLLLKDMTFAHEGNKTSLDGLVNFEKMHMMAQTMRTIRFCRSRHLVLDPPSPKSEGDIRAYVGCFRVIENQRQLTIMSQKIEPGRRQ
ncbi:rap guanine nucleotide exchange factor 4 isoform X4 [Contarinia nasturtii]|uniref:rap guanine nucleotide exchange factor 4 isoform X4 n=1 Tax=Contarinia nasturtii TaxID=265458 RepID=UPI0012D3BF24|nr:rap guanine nucleotide exchange factor 4 isoform X4 [Contarinia nasturtii]XP_031640325.1 rap guanine nucleotide exchange factor 4 isoform X4 [Contarinia nasturtii]